MELLWTVNEILLEKYLEQCLAHSKNSVSYTYENMLWMITLMKMHIIIFLALFFALWGRGRVKCSHLQAVNSLNPVGLTLKS